VHFSHFARLPYQPTPYPPPYATVTATGQHCKSRSSLLCIFLQPPVTSYLLEPSNFCRALLSTTLDPCSSLNATAPVSYPHIRHVKLQAKLQLCTGRLNICGPDIKREDKRFRAEGGYSDAVRSTTPVLTDTFRGVLPWNCTLLVASFRTLAIHDRAPSHPRLCSLRT
jgi:hypothetical protein